MNEPTLGRRRIGRLLIGAAVLALPLTATITYADSEPSAPVATTPEKRTTKKIMIIDSPAGSAVDEKTLHTRVIERDGRTIVLKTPKPLSDKEADEHVGRAEASLAKAEAMESGVGTITISSEDDDVDIEPNANGATKVKKVMLVRTDHGKHGNSEHHREVRSLFLSADGHGSAIPLGDHGSRVIMACANGKESEALAVSDKDGKKQVVKLKVCSLGAATADALKGLRHARERVSKDTKITDEIKADVLNQLDAEIARLSKEG